MANTFQGKVKRKLTKLHRNMRVTSQRSLDIRFDLHWRVKSTEKNR